MKSPAKHVELLDHLRGVAILAVLVFHTLGMAFGYDALPWKGWWRDFSGQTSFLYFLPLGMTAQAGVAIFFVVSGFCIHLSFQQQGRRWRGFYIRRFFRIYPAYLLALIFSLLILATNPGLDFFSREFWTQLLTHVFLVHNFNPATIYGGNAALWSLAVEAQLYLLYPWLLAVAARLGWSRTLILLAGCEFLIRGVDGAMQTADATNTVAGRVSWLLANSPLGYWFSWALGAVIADAWLKRQPLPFARTSPWWWLGLAVGSHFARPLCEFQFPLFALATAAVAGRGLSEGHVPVRTPAFPRELLKKIGWWSYSIYLLHQPLLHVFSHVIVWAVPAESRPPPVGFLLVMATWLAIIPFSLLWYKTIELPGIALGRRISERGRPSPNDPVGGATTPGPVAAKPAGRVSRPAYSMMVAALAICVAGSLWISASFSVQAALKKSNLAWVLATNPDATKRDGVRAVKLAEEACLQTQYRQPVIVETLAAAYAEAGRFDEAVGAAQLACALASQSGDEELLRKNRELLALYLKHQPYHERP